MGLAYVSRTHYSMDQARCVCILGKSVLEENMFTTFATLSGERDGSVFVINGLAPEPPSSRLSSTSLFEDILRISELRGRGNSSTGHHCLGFVAILRRKQGQEAGDLEKIPLS